MAIVEQDLTTIKGQLSSRWLPWAIGGSGFLAAVLYGISSFIRLESPPNLSAWAFWLLLFSGMLLALWSIQKMLSLVADQRRLSAALNETERRLEDAYQRLETIFRVSQKFLEANDENDVIEPVLNLLVELTGALGAAFVPLDEHGQPQATISRGALPATVMDAWLEHLASPGVRERCSNCVDKNIIEKPTSCPLLSVPLKETAGLLCLSARRGERDYGVMILFLQKPDSLDEKTRIYIRTLIDEMALGMEGVYLRRRELNALRQAQMLRKRADLTTLLASLLENVYETLEADFAMMIVPQASPYQTKIDQTIGDFPQKSRAFIDGIVQGVMTSGEPILLGNVSTNPEDESLSSDLRSLMAAPLLSSERAMLGALLVGNRRARSIPHRQLALLQTIAGQVALVVQNASLMAELEYQSMIQERARLAREIHDGLAQTIGFLKLQASQLRSQALRGDLERVQQNTDTIYRTLSEAYQDARQAIDGLRISPSECGLAGWLEQTTTEFSELSGLPVDLEIEASRIGISSEVQAQLVRILQEALSNIRKHAEARRVWVKIRETAQDFILEVRDDGQGFLPEDIVSASRHGLRGMQERAELVGADFQVVSRPHEGTLVSLRLPIGDLVERPE